jgi:hypothetical protein
MRQWDVLVSIREVHGKARQRLLVALALVVFLSSRDLPYRQWSHVLRCVDSQ